MVSPFMMKTLGYLVSTLSVILLAIASWPKAQENPVFMVCLISGAIASVIGMFFRWLSYSIEKKQKKMEKGGE
jgi:hypothetical protein